ncbi:MAG TPA: hypothetical protein ENI26_10220 [Methylophaga aminisulfidivorans]|uniref:Uncharacterized protein n=1 Tax=Methylophaga aminisulfidivorans TaxID=230105 RepID=A0A7C1ZI65_9GAMM|nr:hypothetical protein [Methylophaga aminisulfidivorans]
MMNLVVNIVQIMIVVAIIYPGYYLWDMSRVEHLCQSIEINTHVDALKALVNEANLDVDINEVDSELTSNGKWQANLAARSSLSGYQCHIEGYAGKVASAVIIEQ